MKDTDRGFKICHGSERLKDKNGIKAHPTQKPIKLLKHLIKIASNEGDVILDPFMGVGSTGVAALEMNRKFVGFEIDTEYFEAAKKRLANAEHFFLTSAC